MNAFTCDYPCGDVRKKMCFPEINLDPGKVTVVLISECPPKQISDYYYKDESGSFFQTTKMAFEDAGIVIKSYKDLTDLKFYLTTAIKCMKSQYTVSAKTIKECALRFLRPELLQFPNTKVVMCMGDFAIKAINFLYKEEYGVRVIPAGSTYKIRKKDHLFDKIRFLPSYTQTGESFNIEKSKRRMIAEDIKIAVETVSSTG